MLRRIASTLCKAPASLCSDAAASCSHARCDGPAAAAVQQCGEIIARFKHWNIVAHQPQQPSTSKFPHLPQRPGLHSSLTPLLAMQRSIGHAWAAPSSPRLSSTAGSSTLQPVRTIFGAPAKQVNKQIHTHDKYKQVHPQPTYDWMIGRFILDRNGVIWHRQANSSHHRYNKSSSQLTRLKRLKPLARVYARKLIKLGFKRRYWADPDARMVPGFHTQGALRPLPRHDAKPDLRRWVGDPALRSI